MSARWAVLFVCLGVLGSLPQRAQAFASPGTFESPTNDPASGGGAGRFFTGSPADGFTCKVCHHGGSGVPVRVLGLPLTGYKTGRSYEVTITWPPELEHVGMNVEITDDHGIAAGTLRLPTPPTKLDIHDHPALKGELCTLDGVTSMTMLAAELRHPINRMIVSVTSACGAHQTRFLWTAPPDDRGAVRITGGLVISDNSNTNDGDGVTEIARIIASRSDRSASASHISGCSVALPTSRPSPHGVLALSLLCLSVALRRRRRR